MKLRPTKENIIEWLKGAEKCLENPDNYPTYTNWLHARKKCIYNAVLGNKEEAMKGFKKAVEYYKRVIEERKENNKILINHYDEYLFSALLTQDEKIIKEVVEEISKDEDEIKKRIKYKDSWFIYYSTFALVNLIKENNNKVEEYLKKLDEYKTIPFQRYPVSDVIKGILKKDTKLLEEGFNKLLKRQVGLVRGGNITTDETLVCIPAVCMLFLAKKRGIDMKIESKYIPKVLFEK